jgi:transcriptional regulator GlxA family with amidase domain
MAGQSTRIRVSLVALPDAMVSPVSGLFEVLASAGAIAEAGGEGSTWRRFEPEIVAPSPGPMQGASGLPITVHRAVDEVDSTDVVVIPSMEMTATGDWIPGRYPGIVRWIRKMHEGGATICSACSGGMLMAETGLLDGHEATTHWASEIPFRARHPNVLLRMDAALVVSGDGDRIVCSGAATAWHDLALYLIARYLGPATAQAVARFQLLQWHSDGQAAFKVFNPPTNHGDAAVLIAQRWIAEHPQIANPIEKMADRAGLSTRTLARRFRRATGQSPVAYVQRIRIEHAKRSLEAGDEPIEEISWAVGYEDSASFRRLFKRLTGLTPGEYRHRFRMPKLAGIPDR